MVEFITENIASIAISAVSIVIGIGVSWLFYRLQLRVSNTAQKERSGRAREDIIDIIESYIVNNQPITGAIILSVINAVERKYEVSLDNVLNSVVLLEDVSLNLQRSRHIDVVKKAEYAAQIQEHISKIMASSEQYESKKPINLAGQRRLALISTLAVTMLTTALAFLSLSGEYRFLTSDLMEITFAIVAVLVSGIAALSGMFLTESKKTRRSKETIAHDDSDTETDKVT